MVAMAGQSMARARSLTEFQEAFPDEASCAAFLFERRWAGGFVCPRCGTDRNGDLLAVHQVELPQLDEQHASGRGAGCVTRSRRVADVVPAGESPCSSWNTPSSTQEFFAAPVRVRRELAAGRVPGDRDGSRYFVADAVQHAPVDPCHRRWHPGELGGVDHCALGKIRVDFHRYFPLTIRPIEPQFTKSLSWYRLQREASPSLFVVVYAAGLLARHYGILPWTAPELARSVITCELAHRQFVADTQVALDPIAAVRAYIVDHLPRFRRVPDASITAAEFPTIPGFIYTDQHGVTDYLISQPVFGRQFAHLNGRRVLQPLDGAGLVVRMGNKYVSKAPIRSSASSGREYVYRIRPPSLRERSCGR